MTKIQCKFNLLISIAILLTLTLTPEPVNAQWPPFRFNLTPSLENDKITYTIKFSKQVSQAMTDVAFKIPLPAGTRFLEAGAPPTTSVDFDGAEVTFFTSVLHRPITDAFFVVELTDPTTTVFTTHAWITWKGSQPGDYLTQDVALDITRHPLDWIAPPRSRLQLEASATSANDVITYAVYPKNVGGRMWDLKINVPMPEGTTLLSAEAPPPFVASFDGREVSFFTLELERGVEVGPLRFKVTTDGVTVPLVATHAWATWRNVGRQVGLRIAAQEEVRTGDIIVQPHASQWVVSDISGDVPFANYDVTSIALEEDGTALKIMFHTAEALRSVGEPVEYFLYIDSDCRLETGFKKNNLGLEYRVRYRHNKEQATLHFWDTEEEKWRIRSTEVSSRVNGNMVTMWAPVDILETGQQFCWVAEARNTTKAFNPNPPTEKVPNGNDLRVTQHEVLATPSAKAQPAATGPSTNTVSNESNREDITPPQ